MTQSLEVRSAPSILVVDDQPTVRRMAHRLLSEWGFRVFEAETGEEAMEVLETARAGVQLVIVDVVMPLADGVQVTRHIQERCLASGSSTCPPIQPRCWRSTAWRSSRFLSWRSRSPGMSS